MAQIVACLLFEDGKIAADAACELRLLGYDVEFDHCPYVGLELLEAFKTVAVVNHEEFSACCREIDNMVDSMEDGLLCEVSEVYPDRIPFDGWPSFGASSDPTYDN